jgi:hypothetical protein
VRRVYESLFFEHCEEICRSIRLLTNGSGDLASALLGAGREYFEYLSPFPALCVLHSVAEYRPGPARTVKAKGKGLFFYVAASDK